MMKKLVLLALFVLTSLSLVACGKPDVSGKWYLTLNTDERQIDLLIEEDQVTINYSCVKYETGLFSVNSEVITGKLASGKIISGSEIEITETYRTDEALGTNIFQGAEKFNYSLSKDKETLSLSIPDEEGSLDFVKKNPSPSLN